MDNRNHRRPDARNLRDRGSYIIQTSNEFSDIKPPEMLIEGLIPRRSITLVTGAKYTGKTFFALEAMRAVAAAMLDDSVKFMGKWAVKSAGYVMLLEQDSPDWDTGRALAMMLRDYHARLGDRRSDIGAVWHPGVDMLDGFAVEKIVATAMAHAGSEQDDWMDNQGNWHTTRRGPELIVLDSGRSLHRGDENESSDMEIFMQNVKFIRDNTGAAIILIAHDGAKGDRTRGSTAIDAAADSEFAVSKHHGVQRVHIRKSRAISPGDFRYRILTDEATDTKQVLFAGDIIQQEDEEEVANQDARASFMVFLGALTGPSSLREIDQQARIKINGITSRQVENYVGEAVKMGFIQKIGAGKSTKYLPRKAE